MVGKDTLPGSSSRSDVELRRIEQDAHEEPVGTVDPARPGRQSGVAIGTWSVAFLLAVVLFFYSLGSC